MQIFECCFMQMELSSFPKNIRGKGVKYTVLAWFKNIHYHKCMGTLGGHRGSFK